MNRPSEEAAIAAFIAAGRMTVCPPAEPDPVGLWLAANRRPEDKGSAAANDRHWKIRNAKARAAKGRNA